MRHSSFHFFAPLPPFWYLRPELGKSPMYHSVNNSKFSKSFQLSVIKKEAWWLLECVNFCHNELLFGYVTVYLMAKFSASLALVGSPLQSVRTYLLNVC
jgi:hypothetical protein